MCTVLYVYSMLCVWDWGLNSPSLQGLFSTYTVKQVLENIKSLTYFFCFLSFFIIMHQPKCLPFDPQLLGAQRGGWVEQKSGFNKGEWCSFSISDQELRSVRLSFVVAIVCFYENQNCSINSHGYFCNHTSSFSPDNDLSLIPNGSLL